MATNKNTALDDLKTAFAAYLDDLESRVTANRPAQSGQIAEKILKGNKKAAEVEEDEDDAEEGDEERERLAALSLVALKKEAVAAGFDAADLKGASKEDIIDAMLADDDDEEEEEDDEDEDVDDASDDEDEDEDDEEEGEEYDRDELEGMTLRALRTLAKESDIDPAGLDKDAIIDALMGEGADEEDEDDEEEEDDDEDAEELTEDDLNEMSETELKKLCAEMDVKIRKNATKKSMVAALLDAGE